jgi:hypothetical protein
LRIDLCNVIEGPPFWGKQGPPYLPSPFFDFYPDGNLIPPDYTVYDAHLGPRLDGSRYDDGVPVNMINVQLFVPGIANLSDTAIEATFTDEEYVQAAADMARHLKEKGWWERIYVYVHDEPSIFPGALEAIAYDVSLMKMADPDWESRMMVTNHWVPEIQYSIGIWCPLTGNYDHWFSSVPEYGREDYQRLIAKGDKLWFYVCNATVPPYAAYDIDTIWGHEPRTLNWGAWYEGATGYLYCCTNYWKPDDPWGTLIDLETWPQGARNGAFLLYPGDHNGTVVAEDGSSVGSPAEVSIDGPVISHRLLMIREGMEDWEYLLLAQNLGGKAFARKVVEGVYTQFGVNADLYDYDPDNPPWTYDEEDMYEARSQLARFIASGGWPGKDDDGDGFWGCSISNCRPQYIVVSFILILGLVMAIQIVVRIKS